MNDKFGKATIFMLILLVSIALIPAATAKTYTVGPGQTYTLTKSVSSGTTITPYLVWMPVANNNLDLTIYSPTGERFGTWYDNVDGSVNGVIQFSYPPIQKPAGLAHGTWTSYIHNGGTGTAQFSYTFTVA